MRKGSLAGIAVTAAGLCLVPGSPADAQTPTPSAVRKEEVATMHATGAFDVEVAPQATEEKAAVGRMSLDKQYHGDLEGTGKGEMLTAGSASGSGAYVALERVEATLMRRKGAFVLHHRGIMTRGAPSLEIAVVPDSGSGELAGIAGRMTITVTDGKHFYDLEYTLPEQGK